ncbi:MAG TPA: hypothetical protein VFS76_02665 [Pyrinomonadaceae bacterium]|nr:hypothetical protein [Pyrinomonadaceae bacterium]
MKQIALVLFIGFVLSLCNLSERFKKGSAGSGSSTSVSSDSGGKAEPAQLTAAQTAAIAGGKEVKWDRQGMSWTVPANWTETTNESKTFTWRSPGGFDAASLIVTISPMTEEFPVEASLDAYFEQAQGRAKNGEVDEVKWVEIDGLKGVQFREAKPEKPDDFRRLQWLAYRKYLGQVQGVNVMMASNGTGFEQHKDAMYGVLYSMKIAH